MACPAAGASKHHDDNSTVLNHGPALPGPAAAIAITAGIGILVGAIAIVIVIVINAYNMHNIFIYMYMYTYQTANPEKPYSKSGRARFKGQLKV